MIRKNKGQVWVETVIYTLIGLALIAIVLAFFTPKFTGAKDSLIVEQSIESLKEFDERINTVLVSPSNRRSFEITMKKGELFINGDDDEIVFILREITNPYSQPGVEVDDGRVKILTETGQKSNTVTLRLKYGNSINLGNIANGQFGEDEKKYTRSATPYTFFIENMGIDTDGKIKVGVRESTEG